MKNILLPSLPADAADCLNLRPHPASPCHALTPVGAPATVDSRAWRLLGSFADSADNITELYAHGNTLGACSHPIGTEAPRPYVVADDISGNIMGVYRSGTGFTVLTDERQYTVVSDESSMLRVEETPAPEDYQPLMTVVSSESVMQVPVGGFKLTGQYDNNSAVLNAEDTSRLGESLAEAYKRASADATAAGQFVAPVLVRYIIYDSRGKVAFESVPRLHVATGRHDGSLRVTLGMNAGSVSHGSMAVPVYKLSLQTVKSATGSHCRDISRIDVQVSPQIHSFEESLTPLHHINSAGSVLSLTATPPGCSADSGALMRLRRNLLKALEAADSLFTTVLTVHNPFKNQADMPGIEVGAAAASVADEKRLLAQAKAVPVPDLAARARLPHRLTGTAGINEGGTVIIANPVTIPFKGHLAEYFTNHGDSADDTETVARVRLADGTQVVSHNAGRFMRSVHLSPLIAYPDPEATEIEMQLCDSNGTNRTLTLPLTRCGRFACYIDPGVKPIALEHDPAGNEFYIPLSTAVPRQHAGHIIALDPEGNMSIAGTGGGCIKTLHRVARPSSSAWEASRSRLLLAGAGGIFSMALNGGRPVAPVSLDPRPVTRADAVATITPTGSAPVVCAIAGGDLVAVSGNRVTTLARNIGADMLVWDSEAEELLAITASDNPAKPSRALVMHPAGGWAERTLPPVTAAGSDRCTARITSEALGELYDPTRTVDTLARCRYRMQPAQPVKHPVRGVPFITEVVADIAANDADGTLTIAGHHGNAPERTFSRLIFKGTVNRPLVHHLMMPPRCKVSVTLDSLLSPGARISPFCIYYRQ